MSGFDRNDFEGLERALREERPQPSDEFVRSLSRDVPRESSLKRLAGVRLAFAAALTVVLIAAFGAAGGFGYASKAASGQVTALTNMKGKGYSSYRGNSRRGERNERAGERRRGNNEFRTAGGRRGSNDDDDEDEDEDDDDDGDRDGDDEDDEEPDDDQYEDDDGCGDDDRVHARWNRCERDD
jgi:hypothetical protein